MTSLPRLNLPPCTFRIRREEGVSRLWDPLRRMWLVLTPEEWVRQHLIRFLIEQQGVASALIVQEYPVLLNRQPQRADLVVTDRQGTARLLVECKAPGVKLDTAVLAQAVRYNSVVKAPYILLTDGVRLFCYHRDPKTKLHKPCDALPDLRDATPDPSST